VETSFAGKWPSRFCAGGDYADSVALKDVGREGETRQLRYGAPRKFDYFMLLTVMVSSFMVPLIVTCLPAIDVTLA